MDKIAVIIPCFNEEKSVCAVIDEVWEFVPNAEIWIFDNNSTDKSYDLVSAKIAQIQSYERERESETRLPAKFN